MGQSNLVKVRIHGKEYTLKGQESEEYLQKIANYIDKKMAEVSKNSVRMSGAVTATLTCVNVADEYFKTKESITDIKKQLEQKNKEIESCEKELNDLKGKYTEVQLELANLKKKLEDASKKK